jgi:hypothetical protein
MTTLHYMKVHTAVIMWNGSLQTQFSVGLSVKNIHSYSSAILIGHKDNFDLVITHVYQ